jgi:tRNA(Arg) A34 adenosine deaminase TadA
MRKNAHVRYPEFTLKLPPWIEDIISEPGRIYPTVVDRMCLAVELSRLNVVHGTGGPFGAGVFSVQTNQLLAPGVNLVLPANASVLHAEVVATLIAQQMVGHYDLGAEGMPPYELVVGAEPCAMCIGMICWSGVRRLVISAPETDVRAIGFDEGPKHPEWSGALKARGITVVHGVCRAEASAVLRQYVEQGGMIYNARQGDG